ncbi:uncharacterized protein LOC119652363 [Hermetia illucens]|uniref:uncharacterized protein LOC119652363 n=1 Tax=Hermetia illucens TaxID=343691 RepID=UPI0018CC5CEF|nr:uncharacterized protein LOC119652363 [Hermetia illucens]
MTTNNNRIIRQKNGEIVMEALKRISGPATFTDVVTHIANKQNVNASVIKEPVKNVLCRGVEYGFIKKLGGRYTTDGIRCGDPTDAEDSDSVCEACQYYTRRRRGPYYQRRYRCLTRRYYPQKNRYRRHRDV